MSTEAREDHAVLEALDALRDSSPDDLTNRHKLIDALTKLPATSPLAREARDRCAEAYRLMAEGKEATSRVKAELERLGFGAKDAEGAPKPQLFNQGAAPKNATADLAVAEDKLKKSEPAMRACQKAAVELTVKRRK